VTVDGDEVRRIARLARLALLEEDLVRYAADLNQILAHMRVLEGVPSNHTLADEGGVQRIEDLRPDSGKPIALDLPLERWAPQVRDGFILVPRLDTHGQAGE
jgi:aspartyl/glutamyl-tRNA(Asn/Gln) amidotransferase C subunit